MVISMTDEVGDCPNCGKRSFILHRTVVDGHKGLMGRCYDCGHEEFIDQGPIHTKSSGGSSDNEDPWRININPKWWF
jgi:hypothetical protein